MEAHLEICDREILCVDCDSETCWHAGKAEADCPKWTCDTPDVKCEDCEFLKEYVKNWRETHEQMQIMRSRDHLDKDEKRKTDALQCRADIIQANVL